MSQTGLHISEILSYSEIEKLYENSILTQDFYGEDYAPEWKGSSDDAKEMAKYIKETFNPKKVIDVGCGIGKLVKELRKLKIDAFGIEFSKSFINASPVKKYLYEGDIFHLPSQISDQFDLVVCMEVLEHLPPTKLSEAINNLKKLSSNNLLITIPCFGPDYNYNGLPLNEECWLQDAQNNVPFHNLVVDSNGIPHLGHISLATRRWWSSYFLLQGLIRKPDIELIGYDRFNFLKYGWNIFILSLLDVNSINVRNSNFFLKGIYNLEEWGADYGDIRWTMQYFNIFIYSTKSGKKLSIRFFSGPKELIFNREILLIITRISEVDLKIYEEKIMVKNTIEPNKEYCLDFDINYFASDVIKIQGYLDEPFIPHYLIQNRDGRELGIALQAVQLI